MKNPIKRNKPTDPVISKGLDIPNQGHVPGAMQQDVGVPPAPRGEQTARGFGAMMRPQKFVVR